eukprot:6763882-Prymnesium_polylepis.1
MPRHELIKKLENKSEADVLAHVDAQPGDVAVKDDAGRLPLHVAVDNKASDAVVKKLLEAYPQAAAITTGYDKKLPLHLAVRSQPSEVVVQLLLDAYPEGAQALDEVRLIQLAQRRGAVTRVAPAHETAVSHRSTRSVSYTHLTLPTICSV